MPFLSITSSCLRWTTVFLVFTAFAWSSLAGRCDEAITALHPGFIKGWLASMSMAMSPAADSGKAPILVVDDDRKILNLVRTYLEREARVNAILRRTNAAGEGRPARPAVIHWSDLVIDRDRYEVRQAGRPLGLTAAEFRLLAAILQADGRVLSRELLLDVLYGVTQADALDRTIDVHIGRLRDKLGDDADRPRYIATVRGIGYRAAGLAQGAS